MFLLLLKEFIFIFLLVVTTAGVMPCGSPKGGPYIVHSAVYNLHLVLWDQQKYSEKSENIIGLDPYILNSFIYSDPI